MLCKILGYLSGVQERTWTKTVNLKVDSMDGIKSHEPGGDYAGATLLPSSIVPTLQQTMQALCRHTPLSRGQRPWGEQTTQSVTSSAQ